MVLSQQINRISPLARAILVIGAVAALVTGITAAALTSNTVSLTENTLAAATATLVIDDQADCTDSTGTSVQGMSFTNLVPGEESDPFTFCLRNDGDLPLDINVSTATDFTGSPIAPNLVTLKIDCGAIGTVNTTLDLYAAPTGQDFTAAALDNTDTNGVACAATATLDSSVEGGSVTPFQLDFVGTQVEAT